MDTTRETFDDGRQEGDSLYIGSEVMTSKLLREKNERKMIVENNGPKHTNCCSRGLFKLDAFIW